MMWRAVEKEADLRACTGGLAAFEDANMATIHAEDMCETGEVRGHDRAGAQAFMIIAMGRGDASGTRIGRFAAVVVVSSRGVDVDRLEKAGIGNQATKHTFGGGRAADIAGANEQDAGLHGHWFLFVVWTTLAVIMSADRKGVTTGEVAKAETKLARLLGDIRSCRVCADHLPLGPRPVLRASVSARLLIIGQAPGTRVHETGIPWNDPSGDRLRRWLGIDRDVFYYESRIAIVPTGFCYPGRGRSGDLPPRPECTPLWHARILANMPNVKLTLLVGSYAQAHYLGDRARHPRRRRRGLAQLSAALSAAAPSEPAQPALAQTAPLVRGQNRACPAGALCSAPAAGRRVTAKVGII